MDLSLAAVRSAASRFARGPTRTRYRTEVPEPPGNTYTGNPCALSCRDKFSAFVRLAKLPSCTAHAARADMGEDAVVSTGAEIAGEDVVGADVAEAGGSGSASAPCVVLGAEAADAGGPGDAPEPGDSVDPGDVVDPGDAGDPCVAAVSTSALAGAWLVAKSTVTCRVGSGATAG